MTKSSSPPEPSAVSALLLQSNAKSETTALPLELLHNLQYQHSWRDLQLHFIDTRSATPSLLDLDLTNPSLRAQPSRSHTEDKIYLISGLPPRHAYLHPDFQNQLIRHKIPEKSATIQREWVLPTSLGTKWTLKRLCQVFDALSPRQVLKADNDAGDVEVEEWKDAKRVLMGMLSTNGMGGDGTAVYYIMQEGEVKPRQNG
jgi:tRNA-splicing endonuclease subunit Sen15, fungi type